MLAVDILMRRYETFPRGVAFNSVFAQIVNDPIHLQVCYHRLDIDSGTCVERKGMQ